MANQQDKRGRRKSGPAFLKLPNYLQDSAAWGSLTPAERSVFLQLRRRYNGRNNGHLALSARDAARECKVNKDTAAKAFRTLAERGFIEIASPSAFAYKLKRATEYRLTDERCDRTGAKPSNAFMRWRP